MIMTREQLGEALAQSRIAQGITIREIAERCSTSTRAVQAAEKGWYNVGIDTYLALAQQLGVELQFKPIERSKGAE
jgi:transcriptional regulator with XRE-family HTH domain